MHQPNDHLSQLTGGLSHLGPETGSLVWTHSQLRRAALLVAGALIASGVQRGSTLVTLISNRVEWPLLQYACTLCGATFAPLDYGALSLPREVELKNFMTRLKPDAVVVATEEDARSVDSALSKTNQATPKVQLVLEKEPGSGTSQWISLLDLTSRSEEATVSEDEVLVQARARDPDRINMIAFTSGTSSGRPKGCRTYPKSLKTQVLTNPD